MLKYIVMLNKFFNNISYYVAASLCVLYLEIVLMLRSGFEAGSYMFLGVLFCAFSFGAVICFLSSLFKNPKVNGWIFFALIELVTIFFLVEFFCNQTYNVFMDLKAISSGAGNVANEYMGIVLSVIKNGILTILLFEVPSIIILVLCIMKKMTMTRHLPESALLLVMAIIMFFCSSSAMTLKPFAKEQYTYNYMFSEAVKSFGLTHSTLLDIKYIKTGVPEPPLDTPDNTTIIDTDPTDRNQLDFAWDNVMDSTDDASVKRVLSYIQSQKGSNKNEYTGLFEGKNLVLLCVESMSKEMIIEDLYPLMYRMMTKGIVFEDYYVPFWGGSTTSGEMAVLTGLIPMYNTETIQMTIGHDNSYTLASMLSDQMGYWTAAYHNGNADYYNREVTHPGLGFSKFDANNSDMYYYLNYSVPPSDDEMLRYIADDIEDVKDPFYLYIMTYSGHGNYSFEWGQNQMGWKNHERLAGTYYYDDPILGGYISGSMELEIGLEEFVRRLEASGELDDTVFVITSDHYPYFLQEPLAWGGEDYTKYLYGYQYTNNFQRDHNALIIWSPCLEEDYDEPIVVSEPVTQIDILPTLLNLFGVEFDSRVYAGRDVFSDELGIAIWPSSSWVTSKGHYMISTGEFTPNEGVVIDDVESYVSKIQSIVTNKIFLSRIFVSGDLYSYLSPYIITEGNNISVELEKVADDDQLLEIVKTMAIKINNIKMTESD